ncbi:hypothetical protein ACERII_00405 [Evansella sp. AB-rgal1]|uniref:hypothetical protein n=1 Tax=Evansella sp. AB-rgal1 TaxID=3242696 RepID=UPI00359E6AEA
MYPFHHGGGPWHPRPPRHPFPPRHPWPPRRPWPPHYITGHLDILGSRILGILEDRGKYQ